MRVHLCLEELILSSPVPRQHVQEAISKGGHTTLQYRTDRPEQDVKKSKNHTRHMQERAGEMQLKVHMYMVDRQGAQYSRSKTRHGTRYSTARCIHGQEVGSDAQKWCGKKEGCFKDGGGGSCKFDGVKTSQPACHATHCASPFTVGLSLGGRVHEYTLSL